ncbi:MAG: putative transport system permease protein [Candidatus Poribacteria bacterium]|nr:putative transport system permease protein [Candidatus Poribacteria bacterium]
MRKYLNLAYKNLYRRKIRSLLTIGGVGVAVAVLVSLLGFNSGYRKALNRDINNMGYQVLVTAKGCPYELATVALAGAGSLRYLTDDTVAKIKEDKDVVELTPMMMNASVKEDGNGFYTFWGIDRDSYTKLRPMVKIASGKHKEKITDPATGMETEKEVDGPMGRWFNTVKVEPDVIYLKNGRVLMGLIVGEGQYEKSGDKELDPLTGEFVEGKKTVKTIKIMLPSRLYTKTEVTGVTGIVTLKDNTQIKGDVSMVDSNTFKVVLQGTKQEKTYTKDQVQKIEDELSLKDGSMVTGVLLNETEDGYSVGDVALAYPNIEEIDSSLVETDPQGNPKVVNNSKSDDAIEIVLGWEAAQVAFAQVGQKLTIKFREMDKEKVKEKVTDPISGKETEVERYVEKPVMKSYTFKVVGILERGGSKDDGSYFVQLEQAQKVFKKYKMLTGIGIKLNDLATLPMFTDRMYARKELGETQVISLAEVKGTILNLVQTAKILVMAVAFIAIFVALIGVMNTILMSVFERTQEIGIMKAIGASKFDIFRFIWLETIIICALGGVIGTLIAVFGGKGIEQLIRFVMSKAGYVPAGEIISFTPQIIIACFIGAIVLGILSGIWPAYRAAKMRPIEAIRSGE